MGTKVALPFVGMIMAECAQVGLMIISKIAMSKGMSSFIFVFYSNLLASLILLPLSLLFHRSDRPPLSFSIVSQFFLLGLFGCLANLFGYAGINLSSPTLATSMLNLVPGLIFILAVAFRLEKLDLRTSSAVAKSIGTIVSIGGAFIMTYYRGPPVVMTPLNSSHQLLLQFSNWVIGGLLLAVDSLLTSAWVIIQAFILKKYHAELIVVFFYFFFVSILSAIASLVVERDPSAWSLKPNIRSVAVLYSGVFGSAFQVGITSWCLRQTGPVFVSMFKPLGIVIAAAVGVIFLGDTLYLGSFVGATVIVIGFYAVIWGKSKEQKMVVDAGISNESSSQKVPFLQTIIEETEAFSADN
ncbi:WAT1-related protein At3g28050-like [Euphorbia lathyris]|uniref:WAT1-related protein At3g28050-like n=1 Tax=Euphorbia lathyris TaxID=212925 RepID=UPI003313A0FC